MWKRSLCKCPSDEESQISVRLKKMGQATLSGYACMCLPAIRTSAIFCEGKGKNAASIVPLSSANEYSRSNHQLQPKALAVSFSWKNYIRVKEKEDWEKEKQNVSVIVLLLQHHRSVFWTVKEKFNSHINRILSNIILRAIKEEKLCR